MYIILSQGHEWVRKKIRKCDVIKTVLSVVLLGVNYTGNQRCTKVGYSVFRRSGLILNRLNIQ